VNLFIKDKEFISNKNFRLAKILIQTAKGTKTEKNTVHEIK